jgi:hypothetical protein
MFRELFEQGSSLLNVSLNEGCPVFGSTAQPLTRRLHANAIEIFGIGECTLNLVIRWKFMGF